MTVRVGVITYLAPRGLGYDAVVIRRGLSRAPGIELSFFPADDLYRVDRRMRKGRVRPAAVHGEWAWPEAEQRADLATFVREHDVVITLEVFLREVAAIAFTAGVRILHVPNLEWISDRSGWDVDLHAADLLLAKTEHTERALVRAGFENVTHVPWDVPLDPEPPRPTGRPITLFHSAGIGGSHDPKNPAAVLASFAELLGGREDIRLLVKSQVPFGERKAPLDVASYRKIKNIEIIEGEVPYEELVRLVRDADATVYPSRAEGFGLPLLESLILSVPVVTTDAPPMNEFVDHEANGLLVPGKYEGRHRHVPLFEVDREALASAMQRLTDPGLIDRLKAGTSAGIEVRRARFRSGLVAAIERLPARGKAR